MIKECVKITALFALSLTFAANAEAATVTVNTGYGYYALNDNVSTPGNVNLNNLQQLDYFTYKDNGTNTTVQMHIYSDVALDSVPGLATKPTGIAAGDAYSYTYGWTEQIHDPDIGEYTRYYSGMTVFSLGNPTNQFSFTWGTIDDFNSVNITNNNDQTYYFTGADILANGLVVLGSDKTKYISIFDPAGIKNIALMSYGRSFEAGNINISNVPLPAALPMFGIALAGVAALRRRKHA